MVAKTELPYWLAISHLPRWRMEKKNDLVIEILPNKLKEVGCTLEEFFNLSEQEYALKYGLSPKEIKDLLDQKAYLPAYSFKVNEIFRKDLNIITLADPTYPPLLKKHLKKKKSPTVIYTWGDLNIFNLDAVAIVGSRDASQDSLNFVDRYCQDLAASNKVVVSGFARGVDRQSLDSILANNGKAIAVLPQGILSIKNEFVPYYNAILNGNLLVMSAFAPDAMWSKGLAMARNAYIYGLANEIIVAQSSTKGGTWEGAIAGLKEKQNIKVYYPFNHLASLNGLEDAKRAADELIKLGATAIV